MKSTFVIAGILMILTAGMLAGCGRGDSGESGNSGGDSVDNGLDTSNDILDVADYTVPEEYVVAEEKSSPEKVFYINKDDDTNRDDDDSIPDNISIEVGTNSYAKDDHESFRQAIVRQLAMQAEGSAQIQGSGSTSDQGEILYTFVLEGDDCITTQYYLVGDKRYCLVHETNFTGNADVDDAAESIANSFRWKSE